MVSAWVPQKPEPVQRLPCSYNIFGGVLTGDRSEGKWGEARQEERWWELHSQWHLLGVVTANSDCDLRTHTKGHL